mmetsp:Transcript_11797/g.28588  ORF Transcript_11797/g.28588 Transcript_11797/m.28588 type:complete len:206 (-) Transcript_11797:179-796(-)
MAEEDSDALFALTKRVREAVSLINSLDEGRLAVVVKRLARAVGGRAGPPFSEEELEQLQTRLELSSADLSTVIEACSFFLEKSAYHVIKPPDLSAHLQAAGFLQSHARALADVWEAEAPALLRRLREGSSVGGAERLLGIDWRLHLHAASSARSRLAEPRAIITLKVSDPASPAGKTVPLEMDHAQLSSFLANLDRLQSQLDALS